MNKDITVVYFHGYGSSSASDKVTGLKKYFEKVYAPDIPILWDEADAYLKDFCEKILATEKGTVIFTGTSLGGYWATRMSDYFTVPSVIINPSVTPATTLIKYSNPRLTIAELLKYYPVVPENRAPRIVLIALDDDVLLPVMAIRAYKFADVKTFDKGGHRFDSINIIADNIVELANLDYLSNDNV